MGLRPSRIIPITYRELDVSMTPQLAIELNRWFHKQNILYRLEHVSDSMPSRYIYKIDNQYYRQTERYVRYLERTYLPFTI